MAVCIDIGALARVQHHRGVRLLDNTRALEASLRCKCGALVETVECLACLLRSG